MKLYQKLLIALYIFLPLVSEHAFASAITVSPAFRDIVLDERASTKDVSVVFTNQSSKTQTYHLSAVDFGSLNESGGVAFLGVPTTELEHRYGLVSWIKLDRDQIVLPPAGSQKVAVHIENRASLAPGGHYAALIATSEDEPGVSQDKTKVNLHQVIASLLLLRKEGGAEIGLNAAGVSIGKHSLLTMPRTIDLRFQNPGNVHVIPRGIVAIKDPSAKIISKGITNENSDIILPESFRKIPVSLMKVGNAWLPGRYVVLSSFRYDGNNDIRTSSVSFWYAGAIVNILIVIFSLLLIAWVLIFIRKRRSL